MLVSTNQRHNCITEKFNVQQAEWSLPLARRAHTGSASRGHSQPGYTPAAGCGAEVPVMGVCSASGLAVMCPSPAIRTIMLTMKQHI